MAPAAREALLRRVRNIAPTDAFNLPWVYDTWRARVPEVSELRLQDVPPADPHLVPLLSSTGP